MAIDRNPLRSRLARMTAFGAERLDLGFSSLGGSPGPSSSSSRRHKSIKQRYFPRLEALEDRYMPALPGFSIVDAFVAEGNSGTTAVQFRILLDQAAAGPVRVDYATADGGTATSGVDFTATSGTANFNPGEREQIITVPIIGDTNPEGAETIVINLRNASGGAIIVDNMAIATILDEEYATTAAVDPLNQDFGVGGTASQGTLMKGDDVSVDGNNRAVVVGGFGTSGQVVRYNPNGTLDKTFGSGGVVDVPGQPGGVAAYTDPRSPFFDYVVVGSSASGAIGFDINVTRLNPDGTRDGAADSTPDTKFGNNGTVTLDLGGDETVTDVEVKATGEVVVAGTTSSSGIGSQAFVVVFNPDGTVQSTTIFQPSNLNVASVGDIAIDSAGNILIAGTTTTSGGVTQGFTARIRAGGGLDTTYSTGPVPGLDSASGIAVSSTGQIVVSGEVGEKATLVGLKSSGGIDGAFGTSGVVTEPTFSNYTDVDFDTFGNLVVTGSNSAAADSSEVIARYTATGQPDKTFNTNNQTQFIVIDKGGINEEGDAVAIAPNGQIFVVGTSTDVSNSSMTTTNVIPECADIVATATATTSAALVGDTFGVTYTVTNNGPQPSGEVTGTASLPPGVNIVSSSVPFTQSGTTITWQLGTLAPGQTVVINATFQPTKVGLGAPTLVAFGNVPDPDTTNNFGFDAVLVGDISVSPAEITENLPAGTIVNSVFTSDEETLPLNTVAIVAGVGDASLFTIDASGNLVSTAPLDFEASPTRTVTITGISNAGETYTKNIIITVLDANDPPVAVDDTYSTVETAPLPILTSDLIANDTDQDAGAVLFFNDIMTFPTNGTLTATSGGFIYQANPGYTGPDSFTYSVTDGSGTISIATVFINVVPFNDPPVGTDDVLISVFEDSGALVIPFSTLLANDSAGPGEAGQAITIIGVNSAVGGTVAIVGTDVVFTPSPNYNGLAQFNYVLADAGGAVAVVNPLVTFAVISVNDAPTGTPDVIGNITEDSGPVVIPFSQLLANDGAGAPDEAGQSLTIVSINSVSGGTAVIIGSSIVFTPFPDYFGPASFTYVVQDNGFSSDIFDPRTTAVPVTFTVTEVNDPPTAIDLVLPSIVGATFLGRLSLTAGDSVGPANEAGQTLTVVGVSNSVGGTVAITSGGVVFVPNPGFTGVASFTVTLQDNGSTIGVFDPRLATATVRFTVANGLPSAAGAVGNYTTTTLVVPGIPRAVDTTATTTVVNGVVSYQGEDSIRILMPPGQANRAATWGEVDARLVTVTPLFQGRTDLRTAGPTTVSPGDLNGSPEAPRRGRLMQIVNSQFDGEDNVNIFEQLLAPPSVPAGTPATPNVIPGGAALPAPAVPDLALAAALEIAEAEAPVERTATWRDHLTSFGMGFLLVASFFANLALAPIVDRRPFAQTKPREKKRTM